MRYIKDCISLSSEHEYPLLRQVLRSGFITHDQLFEFMQLGKYESSRSSLNRRSNCVQGTSPWVSAMERSKAQS